MENLEEEKIEVNGERFEPLEHLVFSKYLKLDLIFPSTPSKTLKNYKIFEPNWFRQDHGKKPVQLHPEAEKRYMKNDNFTLQYFLYKTQNIGVSRVSKQLPFLWSHFYVECEVGNTKLKSPKFYLISKPPEYYQKSKNQPKKRKNDPVENFTFNNPLTNEEEYLFKEFLKEETLKIDEFLDFGFLEDQEPNEKVILAFNNLNETIDEKIFKELKENKEFYLKISQKVSYLDIRIEYLYLSQNITLIDFSITNLCESVCKNLNLIEKDSYFIQFITYLLKFNNYNPMKQNLYQYLSELLYTTNLLYRFIQMVRNLIKEKDFSFSVNVTNLGYNLKNFELEYTTLKNSINSISDSIKSEEIKDLKLHEKLLEFFKSNSLKNIESKVTNVYSTIFKFKENIFKNSDFDKFPTLYINMICQILDYKDEMVNYENCNMEWMQKRKKVEKIKEFSISPFPQIVPYSSSINVVEMKIPPLIKLNDKIKVPSINPPPPPRVPPLKSVGVPPPPPGSGGPPLSLGSGGPPPPPGSVGLPLPPGSGGPPPPGINDTQKFGGPPPPLMGTGSRVTQFQWLPNLSLIEPKVITKNFYFIQIDKKEIEKSIFITKDITLKSNQMIKTLNLDEIDEKFVFREISKILTKKDHLFLLEDLNSAKETYKRLSNENDNQFSTELLKKNISEIGKIMKKLSLQDNLSEEDISHFLILKKILSFLEKYKPIIENDVWISLILFLNHKTLQCEALNLFTVLCSFSEYFSDGLNILIRSLKMKSMIEDLLNQDTNFKYKTQILTLFNVIHHFQEFDLDQSNYIINELHQNQIGKILISLKSNDEKDLEIQLSIAKEKFKETQKELVIQNQLSLIQKDQKGYFYISQILMDILLFELRNRSTFVNWNKLKKSLEDNYNYEDFEIYQKDLEKDLENFHQLMKDFEVNLKKKKLTKSQIQELGNKFEIDCEKIFKKERKRPKLLKLNDDEKSFKKYKNVNLNLLEDNWNEIKSIKDLKIMIHKMNDRDEKILLKVENLVNESFDHPDFLDLFTNIQSKKEWFKMWDIKRNFYYNYMEINIYLKNFIMSCHELKESSKFSEFLGLVLTIGNYLNHEKSYGFKMKTLLELHKFESNRQGKSLFQYICDMIGNSITYQKLLELPNELIHISMLNFHKISELRGKLDALIQDQKTIENFLSNEINPKEPFKIELKSSIEKQNHLIEILNEKFDLLKLQINQISELFMEDPLDIEENFFRDIYDFLILFNRYTRKYISLNPLNDEIQIDLVNQKGIVNYLEWALKSGQNYEPNEDSEDEIEKISFEFNEVQTLLFDLHIHFQ